MDGYDIVVVIFFPSIAASGRRYMKNIFRTLSFIFYFFATPLFSTWIIQFKAVFPFCSSIRLLWSLLPIYKSLAKIGYWFFIRFLVLRDQLLINRHIFTPGETAFLRIFSRLRWYVNTRLFYTVARWSVFAHPSIIFWMFYFSLALFCRDSTILPSSVPPVISRYLSHNVLWVIIFSVCMRCFSF